MLKTALGRFRMIALYEGLSYLVLLIIAMPMKYLMDIPQPVTIVGALHGLLFVLYMLALAQVAWQKKMENGRNRLCNYRLYYSVRYLLSGSTTQKAGALARCLKLFKPCPLRKKLFLHTTGELSFPLFLILRLASDKPIMSISSCG